MHNRHDPSASVKRAKSILSEMKNRSDSEPVDRLAIMLLYSQGFQDDHARFLRCCIEKIIINLISHTPADIYVWLPLSQMESRPQWLLEKPFVITMPIEKETWSKPQVLQIIFISIICTRYYFARSSIRPTRLVTK